MSVVSGPGWWEECNFMLCISRLPAFCGCGVGHPGSELKILEAPVAEGVRRLVNLLIDFAHACNVHGTVPQELQRQDQYCQCSNIFGGGFVTTTIPPMGVTFWGLDITFLFKQRNHTLTVKHDTV